MIMRSMTAEEFVASRYELEEGGRWSELILGESVSLVAPPPKHGTAVLYKSGGRHGHNLSTNGTLVLEAEGSESGSELWFQAPYIFSVF